MDLIFNDTGKAFHYTWEYVDKFLEPVYEIKIDGVAILKIWENDLEHTREGFKVSDRQFGGQPKIDTFDTDLVVSFPEEIVLLRLIVSFGVNNGCIPIQDSVVKISSDGKSCVAEKDSVPFPQIRNKTNLDKNSLNIYLAAKKASFIKLSLNSKDSCLLNKPQVSAYIFDNLPPDQQ